MLNAEVPVCALVNTWNTLEDLSITTHYFSSTPLNSSVKDNKTEKAHETANVNIKTLKKILVPQHPKCDTNFNISVEKIGYCIFITSTVSLLLFSTKSDIFYFF